MKNAIVRIARPTDNLEEIVAMYRDGLGLLVLGSFAGHSDFDGAMLGFRDSPYHLEFTRETGHTVGRAPTKDNLLVFYLPDHEEWVATCERMVGAGFVQTPSYNPYWDKNGATFEDIDGYRVVLQNASWPITDLELE